METGYFFFFFFFLVKGSFGHDVFGVFFAAFKTLASRISWKGNFEEVKNNGRKKMTPVKKR